MAEAVYPEKEPFTSTFMYLDRVGRGGLLRFKFLYWALEYNRGEKKDYSYHDPSSNWSLRFGRRKKSYTVLLKTGDYETVIQGFVAHQLGDYHRRHSEPVPAKVTGCKTYKLDFPPAMIHDEKNEILLSKGCLVLGFMFDTRRLMSPQIGLPVEKRLTSNFMKAHKKRLFTDFIIRANGEEFHVHKAILAARSMYFHQNEHQEEKEITVHAASKTVEQVIHHLYSGELPQLTLNELIQVFELSFKLSINSLVKQCTLYFHDVMHEGNAGMIRDVAVRTGARTLVEEANRLCSNTLG